MKLNDMMISIIGFAGIFGQMLVRGVILSPFGYYLSIALSCPSSLSTVGFRSHVSKIVDVSEVGKVFTVSMLVGNVAPVIASAVLAKIFELTITEMAGICFIVVSVISFIAIVIAVTILVVNRNKPTDSEITHK